MQLVFLDTCVIQAAGSADKNKAEAVQQLLKNLSDINHGLVISKITILENLHGLWGEKAREAADKLFKFQRKDISDEVIVVSSFLGGLYESDKQFGPNMGDKIIGATAIMENGLILTENHKDFPAPYWRMKEHFPVKYSRGNGIKTLDLCLYEPMTEIIIRHVSEKEHEYK